MTRDSLVRRIPFLWFSPTWVQMTVFLSQLLTIREQFSGNSPSGKTSAGYISSQFAKCHPCERIGVILLSCALYNVSVPHDLMHKDV